jgi:preprotein translocase subunit SecY
MLSAFINVFRIPDLRKKVLFTLLMLSVYRVGYYVPLPGIDQSALTDYWKQAGGGGGAAEQAAALFSMFTGGSLGQSTIFGLGIMPYISASIILQLLITVVPALEKLSKEGEAGRRKIQEYTRYSTLGLCVVQGLFWIGHLQSQSLVYPEFQGSFSFFIIGMGALITGTMILMWIGEQIDEYGLGNGISLIIMAGIVARVPNALITIFQSWDPSGSSANGMTIEKLIFLVASFVFVVAGAILITQAQRRIPIQHARQVRGRRVAGGQRHYLPLRVNHGGVMPIIFASSFLLFPGLIIGWIMAAQMPPLGFWQYLRGALYPGQFLYEVTYIFLVFFFAYFWTSVQFRPKELADNLRDSGSFIPGLRPGKRTADYLESVMNRITYVGAAFLAIIAVIPSIVASQLKIPFEVSAFLGGTGLLIVVSVILDFVQRLEANLIMRNYEGFLGGDSSGSGGRIRGRQ